MRGMESRDRKGWWLVAGADPGWGEGVSCSTHNGFRERSSYAVAQPTQDTAALQMLGPRTLT